MEQEAIIVSGYVPGSIGRVAELHGRYYHSRSGFGAFFEGKMAIELSELLRQFDAARDGFWTACVDGSIEGSIGIDGLHAEPGSVQLRWFIVSEALAGRGLGTRLLSTALEHCRTCGHRLVYLWTFEGLHAARHLYEKHGFRLVEERAGKQWGVAVNEQRFEFAID